MAGCVDALLDRGEDALVVAHNGSLSLILFYLGLVDEKQLLQREWSFRHGCYSAIQLEGDAAQLARFNR